MWSNWHNDAMTQNPAPQPTPYSPSSGTDVPSADGRADSPDYSAHTFHGTSSAASGTAATGTASGSSSASAAPSGTRKEGGLKALIDLSFRSYATPTVAKILYILTVALGVLAWLGSALGNFAMAAILSGDYQTESVAFLPAMMGVGHLLLGWIPVLVMIIVVRVFLELSLANIRTAEDMQAVRDHLEGRA